MLGLQIVRSLLCAGLLCLFSVGHANDSADQLTESLLNWSASDFTSIRPLPEHVRDVDIRYMDGDDGQRTYMLCGHFLRKASNAEPKWTSFATIKTDPYEQWIGGIAEAHCGKARPVSAEAADLSDRLMQRISAQSASSD